MLSKELGCGQNQSLLSSEESRPANSCKKLNMKWFHYSASRRVFLDKFIVSSDSGEIAYFYSFWENNENAERYDRITLPVMSKLLTEVLDGVPGVHSFGGAHGRLSSGSRAEQVVRRPGQKDNPPQPAFTLFSQPLLNGM